MKPTGYTQTNRQGVKSPRKIGDVVSYLLIRTGAGQTQLHEEYQMAWSEMTGNHISVHSRVSKLRRGVLQITVRNSVIHQELMFRKSELLLGLREKFPDHKLEDLRFRVGEID